MGLAQGVLSGVAVLQECFVAWPWCSGTVSRSQTVWCC